MMKRILAFMLVVLSFTWSVPTQAQIYRVLNSAYRHRREPGGDQKKTAKAPAESEQAIAEDTAQGREEGEAPRLRHSLAGELIP